MKRNTNHVVVGTGTREEFFNRSRARARKLDRGEILPCEIRLSFEDPADLLRVITGQRIRVLRAIRREPVGISDLARLLKRDRSAVDRDVRLLVSLGLVKTEVRINPGHGHKKVVEPLAAKYELTATI